MKIIEFIFSLADGGAETLVKDYALLLRRDGHEVVIVTLFPSYGTANQRIIDENHIRTISVYPDRSVVARGFHKVFNKLVPYVRLRQILREEKPDVLHIHLNVLRYVGTLGKRFLQPIRLLYTCHSTPEYNFGDRNDDCFAAKKLIRTNRLRLIALHDDMARELNAMFGVNNTVVIRNGIDAPRFSGAARSKAEIRASLGIAETAFTVGHIGRFSESKNHVFLVDIFSELHKRNPAAFLLLVGNGYLRQAVEEKLDRLGLHDSYLILEHRTDIPQLLRAMDVFVFPSLYEGLSVTLVEAQTTGLKCVVSDTINHASFLLDTTIPVSLHAAAEQWVDMILDPTVRHKASGSVEDYDMNKEIKRLEELYEGNL